MMFRKVLYLVCSGFIGGAGMLVLASGRIFPIDPAVAANAIVFVAWQALGVTVSKMGADQIVFAGSVGREHDIDIRPVMLKRVFPAALLFMLFAASGYAWPVAVMLMLSIVIDCAAVLLLAKFNADLMVGKVFVASILNYPVFLLLLYASAWMFTVDLGVVAACFLISSALRFSYLLFSSWPSRIVRERVLRVEGSLLLGAYQAVNYWIFRAGKILAGLSLFQEQQSIITKFIFFWTALELIDRFNLSVVPIVYRKQVESSPAARRWIACGMSLLLALLFLACYQVSAAFLGMRLDGRYVLALTANALLLFPPNYLIFLTTRNEQYGVLIAAGLSSCIVSACLLVMLALAGDIFLALLLYAPCQILLLCVFAFAYGRRTRGRKTYDLDVAAKSL